MSLQLEFLTPAKTLRTGSVDEIIAPSVLGEVGILPLHTEYITLLKEGDLRLRSQGKESMYHIGGGLLTVEKDKVTILVERVTETPSN